MRDTDGQLLQAFATARDEAAFRLLAKRHLGLVFHTALRRTGNRPLAEEISQNVLLALARKSAALAKEPDRLPAWLHRATLFESSKAMRAESSYQRRKQQGMEEDAPASGDIDPAWRDALPHLDLALDKLPEADRRVLLLHYFEDHPFPRIAERTGKNLAAVQKQAQRALEKLSRILRTKGVALSVTALGTGLASHTAKAVPEALVHSASGFALSASSSPLGFSLTAMIASKPKLAVPLALLLLGVPLALQQLAIARQRDQLGSLRESLALSNKSTGSAAANARVSRDGRLPALSSSLDVMVLADEHFAAQRIGGVMQRRFEAKLAGLDNDTLASLIRKTAGAPLGMEKRSGLLDALLSTLGRTDPGLGVSPAIEATAAGPAMRKLIWDSVLVELIARWAETEPADAIAWFEANKDLAKLHTEGFDDPSLAFSAPREVEHLQIHLLRGLLAADVTMARTFLNRLAEKTRAGVIESAILARGESGNEDPEAYLQIVREFLPPDRKDGAVTKLAQGLGRERIAAMRASGTIDAGETKLIVGAALQGELLTARKRQWETGEVSVPDPGTLKWLEEIAPGRSREWWNDASTMAGQALAEQAALFLSNARERTNMPDRLLFSLLTNYDLSSHINEALELAERLQDRELRDKAVDHLNARAKIFSSP